MTSRVKKGRRVTRPSRTPGVSIEREGGSVFCTFEDVMQSTTIEWSLSNARMVADLLIQAIEEGSEPQREVTLASGLVIPASPRAIP